jgi:transcriptional regulator GlxA family with amidase domain
MTPPRVVLLAFPGVQTLDLTGPADVFASAGRLAGREYALRVVAPGGTSFASSSGLRIEADGDLGGAAEPVDTLVVPGGPGVADALRDDSVVAWVRAAAGGARRVASVCNGAFLLAAAGLLDGRRATTHWAACEELASRHPSIDVDPDPIYVRDGNVYTSAGVTAGIDLTLGLVEEDHGRELALEVARWLVLFLKRPGGQSQFSVQLESQLAERKPLRELQVWLPDNLDGDLSVEALAERAFMSPRNFARAFRREVGATPAAYVERLRLERARLDLEATDAPLAAVARRCGFGTVETMRRAFGRRLRVSPSDYRRRFRAADTTNADAAQPAEPAACAEGGHDGGRRHTAV